MSSFRGQVTGSRRLLPVITSYSIHYTKLYERMNTDVLIVDASKGFIKEGKNNKLRASDIKRISDVVT